MLSVAQNVEQKDGKPQVARSITLEVSPQEAEKLSLATQEGHIVLALRATGDDVEAKTPGSNKRDLLAVAAAPRAARGGAAPAPAAPSKYQIEVIQGSNRKVVEF